MSFQVSGQIGSHRTNSNQLTSFAQGGNNTNTQAGSATKQGVIGGGKNIQVVYNGRIATPLSLIPRKPAALTGPTTASTTTAPTTTGANNSNLNSIASKITKIDENSGNDQSFFVPSKDSIDESNKNKVKRSNKNESLTEDMLLYINGKPFKPYDFDEKKEEEDWKDFSTIVLSETATTTILNIPSMLVLKDVTTPTDINKASKDEQVADTPKVLTEPVSVVEVAIETELNDDTKKAVSADMKQVLERNSEYEKLQQRHVTAPDSFIIHTTQTLNNIEKNQNEMTIIVPSMENGTQASSYAILDETRIDDDSLDDESDVHSEKRNTPNRRKAGISIGVGIGTDMNEDDNVETSKTISVRIVNDTIQDFTEIPAMNTFVSDTVSTSLLSSGCLMDTYFQKRNMPLLKPKEGKSKSSRTGQSGVIGNSKDYSNSHSQLFGGGATGNMGGVNSKFGVASRSQQFGASSSVAIKSRGNRTMDFNKKGGSSGSGALTTAISTMGTNNTDNVQASIPGFESCFGPDPAVIEYPSNIEGDVLLRSYQSKKILNSQSLLLNLYMVERAVLQNIYYRKQMYFKDIKANKEADDDDDDSDIENNTKSPGPFFNSKGRKPLSSAGTPTGPAASLKSNLSNKNLHSLDASPSPGGPGGLKKSASFVGQSPGNLSRSKSFAGGNQSPGDPLSRASSYNNMSRANSQFSLYAKNNADLVERLFCYANVDIVTLDREVTCLEYNPADNTLLAVGYAPSLILLSQKQLPPPAGASSTFSTKITTSAIAVEASSPQSPSSSSVPPVTEETMRQGLVLFWSPRNPEYPEKILYTPHGVTAIAFSKFNPLILAVGMNNGDIAVYDMRRDKNEWKVPMETSEKVLGGHSETICQLKWVVRGGVGATASSYDILEDLISVSTDGTVLQWSLRKGFTVSTLMKLKRSVTGEGWLSRLTAGLCFDFPPDDTSTYLVGTEEGSLQRCSVSYNEQSLESYVGHNGPLYKVKISPFSSNIFLTCSSDWSMGLYQVNKDAPVVKFQATGLSSAINDIAWCPGNSRIFAAITADAKLQVWDLSESRTEPFITFDTMKDDPEYKSHDLKYFEQDAALSLQRLLASSTSTLLGTSTKNLGSTNNKNSEQQSAKPVSTLTKVIENLINVQTDIHHKSLTCLAFSPGTHTIAVGDTLGGVVVYQLADDLSILDIANVPQTVPALTDAENTTHRSQLSGSVGTYRSFKGGASLTSGASSTAAAGVLPIGGNPNETIYDSVIRQQRQKLEEVIELLTEPSNVGKKTMKATMSQKDVLH